MRAEMAASTSFLLARRVASWCRFSMPLPKGDYLLAPNGLEMTRPASSRILLDKPRP
jgi:hypothetical protein